MSEKVQAAIARIRAGDRAAGARLLAEALRENPRNEVAWLWLSSVATSDEQRRQCLERVLAISPEHAAARHGLAQLAAAPNPAPAPAVSEIPADLAPEAPAQPAAAETPSVATPPQQVALSLPPTTSTTALPSVQAAPSALALGYALLSRPLLALAGIVFMTALSYAAAVEAAVGSRPEIRGRNRLAKEVYAWLIITLGPQGVLVLGGLLCLLALVWVALAARKYNAMLRASRTTRAAAPRRSAPERPRLSPAVVRGTLIALIVVMVAGFGWAYASRPKPIPGLIAGGTVLDLRDQGLETVSLRDLPAGQITLVDLSGNPLSELPADIAALSQVEHLFVNSAGLTRLPPEIGSLTNLRTLVVADNRLVELPPEIGRLKKLEVLDVHGNQLRSLPPELAQLPNLRQLNLQFNPLGKSAVPDELRNRSSVQIYVMYVER
jgi:hypothetical protein